MHVSNFQKLLSYFYSITLEDTFSYYNPFLRIYLSRGRFQLCTENAIYSFEDKYDNFGSAFKLIDWNHYKPKEVLVLGLGLGSVIQILEEKISLQANYTCVEIDDVIVELAERYILHRLDSPMEFVITDVRYFLQSSDRKYDLILMDIFQDDAVPNFCEKPDFLEKLKGLMNPGALLLYNRLASTKEDKRASKKYYHQNFQIVFPKASIKFLHNNYILFSSEDNLRTKP